MTTKKKSVKPVMVHSKEKEPEYTVQINDPKLLRKDLLESLREVIIFMQGYEKFRAIQEEKVTMFAALRTDLRELSSLLEKLRKLLPKGRLHAVRERQVEKDAEEEMPQPAATPQREVNYPQRNPQNELDELETQLRDIEGQLQGM